MLKLTDNYPLKNVTTLSIGGPARKFAEVQTKEELMEAITLSKDQKLPYLVIGGGSNLLVSDDGVNYLVIKNRLTGITHSGNEVKVKSGTVLQDLVDYTIKHGLAGLQNLAGIPGTVGGAVYGNAGAYGQTISDHLTEVTVLSSSSVIPAKAGIYIDKQSLRSYGSKFYGSRIEYGMTKEDCQFNYRDSIFKQTEQALSCENKDIILEVTFQLEPGDPELLAAKAQDTLTKRLVKYPPGIKCPGSFFKNLVASKIPPEILKNIPPEKIVYGKVPAGALLEEVGAKGQSIDGIEIASYHANLFINQGSGSASAFYKLAKTYAEKVKEKFNISLEPEVQLINLPPI
ncbi:MAG: UDP-N-acetylmuramate dehydrogenase [Candidatus Daviesbacteria bacterium]|nr:UDP-N-acetylmuramate dehydrogenase [Candidatus Daviesbacteria bacterium]